MKRRNMIFLRLSFYILLTFFLFSCSDEEQTIDNSKDTITQITINQTQNEVHEYLSITYNSFNDSVNKNSGFLGWRNVRDYFSLGKETMKEKSARVWYSIYDSIKVTNIVKNNLEDAYISLDKDLNQINVNYISAKEEIGLYSHKIGLSIIANIFEHLLEWLAEFIGSIIISFIVVLIYLFYQFGPGGWIRWSKKRHEKVDNLVITVLRWSGNLCIVIIIISMFYRGDLTENQLKEKIQTNILEQVESQIRNNLK
jgi:hypothetical protein